MMRVVKVKQADGTVVDVKLRQVATGDNAVVAETAIGQGRPVEGERDADE